MSSLPRVVIDARMVGSIPHGIARYVTQISKGLAEQKELSFAPLFLVRPGMEDAFSGFETHTVRTPFLDPKETFLLPFVLKRLKPALYHSPSFSSLAFAPCPYLITLHDLNHLEWGNPIEKIYYEAILKPFIRKAKAVLTVSEFSKFEIERWMPGLKPEVISNAIDRGLKLVGPDDEERGKEILDRLQIQKKRYFLCLSNPKPHKNLPTLLRAFQKFRERSPDFRDYKLVLSVKDYSNEPNVISMGGIGDVEVRHLLKNATALPFPSYYEGFGLPPIEAAAAGVIPLPSKIPAHLEAFRVALDAVSFKKIHFTEPGEPDRWVESLSLAAEGRILSPSPEVQRNLTDFYSIEKIGTKVKEVYERMLK